MPAGISRVVRFGAFEVDLQEGELRKSGLRVKLQEQPFQILIILLEHPGQTVTREELRHRLWSADTFVDFDHSLNSSIKKLREALGDDSDNPRFIETLHRRGYRFIAPVEGPPIPSVPVKDESTRTVEASLPSMNHLKSRRKWAVTVVLITLAILLVSWLRSPSSPPRIRASEQLTDDGLQKVSLVTDGNRIYYTDNLSYHRIAQVSVRGGKSAAVDVPLPMPLVVDVSANQSELLVQQSTTELGNFNSAMWAMPLPAGSPRRLGSITGHDAVWAPDGRLVFAKGNDLYVAGHNGENPQKFASAPDFPTSINFSPDGTRFRFTAKNNVNNTSAIWEARSDGSDMHPLLPGWNNPPAECCGHWTPDGRYYVFQSSQGRATNLWILNDRSRWWKKVSHQPVQLTVGPLQLSLPVPAPNGRKLFAIGTHLRAELVRYDSKSGEFVPYLGGISAGDVDFSQDGQWVTYVSYPEGTLWRSKLDGSARLQLTYPPMYAALAHWSPDGQQIAFSGAVPAKPWKVFLISRDGGNPQAVTADEIQETDPTWSADGKTLAFGHYQLLRAEQTFIELFHLDTRQISELPGSRQVFAPRWSPDGRCIVAISHDNQKLMLYDVKTEKWRQLGEKLPVFDYLTWSRDSAYVYFDGFTSAESGFFRLRLSDAKLDKVADFKNIPRFPDQFLGSWTGLGPGDAPLFSRDISTNEIYSLDIDLP